MIAYLIAMAHLYSWTAAFRFSHVLEQYGVLRLTMVTMQIIAVLYLVLQAVSMALVLASRGPTPSRLSDAMIMIGVLLAGAYPAFEAVFLVSVLVSSSSVLELLFQYPFLGYAFLVCRSIAITWMFLVVFARLDRRMNASLRVVAVAAVALAGIDGVNELLGLIGGVTFPLWDSTFSAFDEWYDSWKVTLECIIWIGILLAILVLVRRIEFVIGLRSARGHGPDSASTPEITVRTPA